MSSFFKPSCLIFWLSWLLCISFLLGAEKFLSNHIIVDQRMESIIYIMEVVCGINIAFSFIGCIFLKCDIHHICCAGMYIICAAIIGPGLSVWGALKTVKNSDRNTPSNTTAFKMVKAHFQKHLQTPDWLSITEFELKCCGIYGPADYRELYNEFPSKCPNFTYDVPATCCVPQHKNVYVGHSNRHSALDDAKDVKKCAFNGSQEWREHIVTTASNTDAMQFNIQQKCDSSSRGNFSLDKKKFESMIHVKGCFPHLKSFYQKVIVFYYVAFIIITICSFLMVFAYGRSFCKSSHITGEKSDYSLDVETVSLLDLPNNNLQRDEL